MPLLRRVYLTVAGAYPERMKSGLQKKLIHAGIDEEVDLWVGRAMTTVLLFSVSAFSFPLVFSNYQFFAQLGTAAMSPLQIIGLLSLPLFIGFLAFMTFLYYIYLFYRVQARTDAIEKMLPDFLLIVVSNLHAGMSPFAAFVSAARPEFGPLEEEIKKVAAKTSSSQSLTGALMDLSQRVDSVVFEKTIMFFEKAVRSGGQMARILHASAEEIRRTQEMRDELLSQTTSYLVFLGFMIIMIAPFLLSVSGQFLGMFLKIKAQTTAGAGSSFEIPIFQGEVNISTQFVEYTAYAFLVLASLFITFFVGSILRGKPLYGIKYFPPIAVASLAMYFISKSMVMNLLSGFG